MNVATIGTGGIVENFLEACKQNDISCLAMYSRVKDHAKALAEKYQVESIYTDLDAMLAREDIDFIYIASPNSLHYSQAKKALRYGKHVICEKPFTSTLAEFDDLLSYATNHHLFLFEAIVTLYMPNYALIKENLAKLGPLRLVQCNFSQYSSRYDALLEGKITNVFHPAFSGGALADIGIYNLHYVIGLFGKPKAMRYYPNMHACGIDTSGVAILEYDGFIATCSCAKDSTSKNISQLQGEKGYLLMESQTSRCSSLKLVVKGEKQELTQPSNPISLYHEVKEFKKIFEAQDHERCQKQLAHSRLVMECYEKLRKDAGIFFEVDQQ